MLGNDLDRSAYGWSNGQVNGIYRSGVLNLNYELQANWKPVDIGFTIVL